MVLAKLWSEKESGESSTIDVRGGVVVIIVVVVVVISIKLGYAGLARREQNVRIRGPADAVKLSSIAL